MKVTCLFITLQFVLYRALILLSSAPDDTSGDTPDDTPRIKKRPDNSFQPRTNLERTPHKRRPTDGAPARTQTARARSSPAERHVQSLTGRLVAADAKNTALATKIVQLEAEVRELKTLRKRERKAVQSGFRTYR